MSYTQELLSKAEEIIPKVTLVDFENDLNSKIMIDVRQIEELKASGSIKGSVNKPKGVIEFRQNNDDEVSYETSIYVFCAVGVRSAIAGYNLKKIGYKNREHLENGCPIILIVGEKEKEGNTVAIRRLGSQKQEFILFSDFLKQIKIEAKPPDLV